jgi:hypothetical protein
VNSSPSRGLFISESTHRASPDLSAIFGPVARKPKPTKPGAQGQPAASAADRPSVAVWETLRLLQHPLPLTRAVLRVRIYLHLAPAAEIERCWRGGVVSSECPYRILGLWANDRMGVTCGFEGVAGALFPC